MHEQQGLLQRLIAIDRNDFMTADAQVAQRSSMQRLDIAKALDILPEESHKAKLAQYTQNFCCPLLPDNDPAITSSKDFDGFCEGVGMFEKSRRFFSSEQVSDI